jgi:hypothetical protein
MISDTGLVVDKLGEVYRWKGHENGLHTFRRVSNMAEAIIIPDDCMERYGLRALYVAEDQPPLVADMLDEVLGRLKATKFSTAEGKQIVDTCNAIIRTTHGRTRE